jgi:Na+/phosphate symporter
MTNISTARILTFLLGCILLRIILATLAYYFESNQYRTPLILMGLGALIIGISFFLIYLDIAGATTANKQLQGWMDQDSKVWWNDLRPLHGALYILFALLAFLDIKYAYVVLYLDVTIGLTAWILHHFIHLL